MVFVVVGDFEDMGIFGVVGYGEDGNVYDVFFDWFDVRGGGSVGWELLDIVVVDECDCYVMVFVEFGEVFVVLWFVFCGWLIVVVEIVGGLFLFVVMLDGCGGWVVLVVGVSGVVLVVY